MKASKIIMCPYMFLYVAIVCDMFLVFPVAHNQTLSCEALYEPIPLHPGCHGTVTGQILGSVYMCEEGPFKRL